MRKAFKRMKSERGQSSTEYMMLVSVVVISIVAAGYVFVPTFHDGVFDLSNDVSRILQQHGSVKGGWGLAANDASANGVGQTSGQASSGPMGAGASGTYNPNQDAGE